MPETRDTQHPQQRPFSGAQRHRRYTQPAPHCCQTKEGLSNLQSVLVNTAPCFPAGNQVTPQTGTFLLGRIVRSPARSASAATASAAVPSDLPVLFQASSLEAPVTSDFNLEELVSFCSAAGVFSACIANCNFASALT